MKENILLTVGLFIISSYFVNAYKLVNCDFESPYRCEAIHGIGLFPVFSLVTVFFESDDE